jgi:hypothetical protein
MIRAPINAHSCVAWFDVRHSVIRLSSVTAVLATACLIVFVLQLLNRPPAVAASADFRSRLDAYVGLRQRISDTIGPLQATIHPAAILARERALAAAIQAARPEARQGDVFTRVAADDVRRLIAADGMRRSMGDQVALMSESPLARPRVNERYPDASPLVTFPALLLDALPPLPDGLEYRFMGRDLILRDVASNLIIDVLPDVIAAVGRAGR